ncbi:hypothetical protein RRG08_012113 [Elysia crispata]|uniref:Uncharacterized protein n=1 Tax=Elysia crispata TaxID=231223 RepID=A0AAE0ZNY1_9GAST|nr:hypothetical protein RRG08_012113 [Elysia crispata]
MAAVMTAAPSKLQIFLNLGELVVDIPIIAIAFILLSKPRYSKYSHSLNLVIQSWILQPLPQSLSLYPVLDTPTIARVFT